MKAFLTCILIASTATLSQGQDWGRWTLQPRVTLGKLLPGSVVDGQSRDFFVFDSFVPMPNTVQYRYAGTSVTFGVRAFPEPAHWLALTLGGGVTWFYRPGSSAVYSISPAEAGVGGQLAPGEFTVYPIFLGAQVIYPSAGRRDFMLFAGLEGRANFVSGDLPMSQLIKPGLAFSGGFAIKVFEIGVRYETFSDIRNIGVYIGVRIDPFTIDFSPEN